MSPVEEVAVRVLAEHHPAGIVNSRDGWVECECGARLPVALDRDGYSLDPDAERTAFDAHRAAAFAAALRADEGLIEAMAEAMIRAGGWKDEPVTQGDRRVARAALDAITRINKEE